MTKKVKKTNKASRAIKIYKTKKAKKNNKANRLQGNGSDMILENLFRLHDHCVKGSHLKRRRSMMV